MSIGTILIILLVIILLGGLTGWAPGGQVAPGQPRPYFYGAGPYWGGGGIGLVLVILLILVLLGRL